MATPADLRRQMKEVVDVMSSPESGSMIWAGIYGADVPFRNVEAICEAMADYCL